MITNKHTNKHQNIVTKLLTQATQNTILHADNHFTNNVAELISMLVHEIAPKINFLVLYLNFILALCVTIIDRNGNICFLMTMDNAFCILYLTAN